MTDSKTNEVVEAMARAMHESGSSRVAWRDTAPLFQQSLRDYATAALTASEPLLAQARAQAVEDAAEHIATLEELKRRTPDYMGDGPKPRHYQRIHAAYDAAIAALSPPSAPGDVGARRVPTSREVMEWGGVDPNAPFEVGPFPMEMRSAQWELEDDDAVLNAIAVMMSEFVDNWPAHKKISTSLALIAKTLRAVLRPPPTVEKLAAAIKTTEYKYFGDYEFSDDQHNAVDTLVNFARHGITALSASAAEGEALRGAWQPIETAPRDGSWFLACSNTPGWGATRVVRFHYPDDRLPIHGEGVMWPSAPTHWRPLPAPPALTSPDGGRNG
jgi:hypothetical protein